MKNNTNIYDFDGELIRKAGDNHKITVEEAQEMMENYRQKLQNVDKDDKRAVIYATYMRNLSNYIMQQYSQMSRDELLSRISTKSSENSVENALKELENDLSESEQTEDGASLDTEMEQPVEEPVVEERKPTIMDEYVDFEEVHDEN